MSQDDKIFQLEKVVENLKQANEKQQGDVTMLNKSFKNAVSLYGSLREMIVTSSFILVFVTMVHFRHFTTIFVRRVRIYNI